jgi:hypothetical protein
MKRIRRIEMKKLILLLAMFGVGALPSLAAVATYNNVPVIDVKCSQKAAANPDAHTRACALGCAASGFGIVTQDGNFLKFDAAGNQKILEALKASSKKDHLRVDVTGDVGDGSLKVISIKLL